MKPHAARAKSLHAFRRYAGAAIVVMTCVAATGALAVAKGSKSQGVIEPSQEVVPLPAYATPAPPPAEATIPPLPLSQTCKPEDIVGVWELQHVYEAPAGPETAAFNANPMQYVAFAKDSRFYRYNAGRTKMPGNVVFQQMQAHSGSLMQYILQDAGMLYVYQDGVASATMVCFIVVNDKMPFLAGNMLLMPPKGQITGRLIKEYKRTWPNQPPTLPGQRKRH